MIQKINHIGIIVRDLEESAKKFQECTGLKVTRIEELDDWKSKMAFFECGEVLIELIEPTGEGDGMTFLKEKGGGVHHICFQVDDIQKTFDETGARFTLKSDSPRPAAGGSTAFFVDEKETDNIIIEFMAE